MEEALAIASSRKKAKRIVLEESLERNWWGPLKDTDRLAQEVLLGIWLLRSHKQQVYYFLPQTNATRVHQAVDATGHQSALVVQIDCYVCWRGDASQRNDIRWKGKIKVDPTKSRGIRSLLDDLLQQEWGVVRDNGIAQLRKWSPQNN